MAMVLNKLLRNTEQSIVDVENRIEAQRAVVARIERAGAEAQAARQLLQALQQSRQTLVGHWEQLRATLRPPAGGTPNDFQQLAARLADKSVHPLEDETGTRVGVTRH